MKRLTEQQINEIIKLYQEGDTPIALAAQFGIYNNSVTRILRKRGVLRNQHVKVPQDQIDQIITEYTAGISSEVIAEKLDIDGTTVCRILKRNGVILRPATQNKRKYTIQQDYFKIIDTEEKAYFLGLMYADGNLSQVGSEIKITLQEEDCDILQRFSNIIYGFVKLTEAKGELQDGSIHKYFTFHMYCQDMHRDLVNLGCPPAKTFLIRFPTIDVVPQRLLWHFVRGYFDGDGCICITDPGRPRIDFSSNLDFIRQLITFFVSEGIECNKPGVNIENTLTGYIQFGAVDKVLQCYRKMYDNATIYMNRKRQTFRNMFQGLEEHRRTKELRYTDLSKYGTSYIPQYDNKLLNSKTLQTMSPEDKLGAVEPLFEFYRQHGFPHTILTENEIIKDFNALKNVNPLLAVKDHCIMTYLSAGIATVKHFSPHFYEVNSGTSNDRKSMLDTFNDDYLLRKVIKNRLDGNFNMTGNMLKQGLGNSKLAYKASIFNPTVAKFIYSKYTKQDDIIYDYSMGFGQRLIAGLSLPYPITYLGVDPMQKTVDSNSNIYLFLKNNIPMFNKQAEILCMGSENYCDPKYHGRVALAFSCPPYFNIEKYENNVSQAYFDNNYLNFINKWWRATVQNIKALLKTDGILALNIKEKIDGFNMGEDMCNIVKECGFILIDTYQVQITRNTVFGHAKGNFKYEPIYFFKKDN
jgi:hypothetical protein